MFKDPNRFGLTDPPIESLASLRQIEYVPGSSSSSIDAGEESQLRDKIENEPRPAPVLVVDDEFMNLMMIESTLEQIAEIRCDTAISGTLAIEAVKRRIALV